jgi:HAD superfamily hydrolase (TIGR01509 family)
MGHGIQAIVFDAFGTLLTPVSRNGPYQLLGSATNALRRQFRDDAVTLDIPIRDLAARYGKSDIADDLATHHAAEIEGVNLFAEAAAYLSLLDWRRFPYAICSNLAHGYGERVKQIVPNAVAHVFSYKVGACKPQAAIYDTVIDLLGLKPSRILFVGDTIKADVEGPRAAGMKAVHIDRRAGETLHSVIARALSDAAASRRLDE